MWGLSSGAGLTIQSFVGDGLEVAVTVFVGLDVHRAQITFDALDVDSGEVQTGRVQPANRDTFRRFLARFDGQPLVAAVEAMTGWRFIVEELTRVGAEVHLAEPADTSAKRGPKRRAKTDRLDARLLRELLMEGRLPEAWIAPAHILDLRAPRAPAQDARRPAHRVAAAHPRRALSSRRADPGRPARAPGRRARP